MNKVKITREKAEVIAQFWADFLKQDNPQDTGEVVSRIVGSAWARGCNDHFAPQDIEAFRNTLVGYLLAYQPEITYVEYDPDDFLQSAAVTAGVKLRAGSLPIKTVAQHEAMRCRVGDSGEWLSLYPAGAKHE